MNDAECRHCGSTEDLHRATKYGILCDECLKKVKREERKDSKEVRKDER